MIGAEFGEGHNLSEMDAKSGALSEHKICKCTLRANSALALFHYLPRNTIHARGLAFEAWDLRRHRFSYMG